ncbi:hypothetical protein Lser_V15G29932 [Lactuca serriola]
MLIVLMYPITTIGLGYLAIRLIVTLSMLWKKKLAVEACSPANADDIEIASHEVSQETKSLKDAISQTGDNLTPTLPDKFEATSPFKYNSPTIVKNEMLEIPLVLMIMIM